MSDLKPTIKRAGQRYVDDPVVVKPKPVAPLERAMAQAFERPLPSPIQVGHERVFLRWMKPGAGGKLVPR